MKIKLAIAVDPNGGAGMGPCLLLALFTNVALQCEIAHYLDTHSSYWQAIEWEISVIYRTPKQLTTRHGEEVH